MLHVCGAPDCSTLVPKGQPRCQACSGEHQANRVAGRRQLAGGADLYNTAHWKDLRARFRRRLAEAGILAACGARLPGALVTNDSTCAFEAMDDGHHKRLTGRMLSTDHIEDHHGDHGKFFDIMNLQLLCDKDHTVKTHRDREGR